MDAVSKFASEDSMEKCSRSIKDSFNKMQLSADLESAVVQRVTAEELAQMMIVDKQQTRQHYELLSNTINQQVK